jgi:HlyD family secretion protein
MDSNKLPEQQIELRSPEMHDIVGRVPNRVIRWGISVIFLVMVTLLAMTWFIRYPDVIRAKVVVTTAPPPLNLVARSSGNLILLKSDNEYVHTGAVIALIQSNTSLSTVIEFEHALLNDLPFLGIPSPNKLGDLLTYHNSLLNAQVSLKNFHDNKSFETQILQLRKQRETYEKLKINQLNQLGLARQELALAMEKYKTDSLLFSQQVTAKLDFNAAKAIWLQQQRSVRNSEVSILNSDVQINQLSRQTSELEIQMIEQAQKLKLSLQQARQEAMAKVLEWKENFLFQTPVKGNVSYLGFLENGQFIEAGKSVFSIVPHEGEIVARAEMPVFGSGKVKVGHDVNIRLENYPFEEFGLLSGKVSSISLIPDEDKYWLTIKIPAPLVTSQNKTLPFKQQLVGTTEIITEDLRLLERFFNQFRKITQRARG